MKKRLIISLTLIILLLSTLLIFEYIINNNKLEWMNPNILKKSEITRVNELDTFSLYLDNDTYSKNSKLIYYGVVNETVFSFQSEYRTSLEIKLDGEWFEVPFKGDEWGPYQGGLYINANTITPSTMAFTPYVNLGKGTYRMIYYLNTQDILEKDMYYLAAEFKLE